MKVNEMSCPRLPNVNMRIHTRNERERERVSQNEMHKRYGQLYDNVTTTNHTEGGKSVQKCCPHTIDTCTPKHILDVGERLLKTFKIVQS